MHAIDLAVAALSACQFGVFSRQQVLDRGGNDALIRRRLRSGQWILVAPVERILADVSPFVGARMVEELVERARLAGHTNPVRLRRELVRLTRSGRDLRRFRVQVERYGDGPVPYRSELEWHLDRILARIPAVAINEAPLPGREWSEERVDRRYELPRRLIVEGDGRRFHTRMADFRRDRERDRTALRHGYPTVRYAYEDLVDDPDGVEAEVLAILGISEH